MDALEKRNSMRLCDLDSIKVCVDRQYENCHGYTGSKKAIYREAILAVKSILHSAKPIDGVEVVRHGRWIDKGGYAVCTECGGRSGTQYDGVEPIPLMTQFCPNCGCRMDGGAD